MRIIKEEQIATNAETVALSLCALFILVLGFDVALGVNLADYTISASLGLVLISGLFYRSQKKKKVSQGAVNKA